MNYFFLLALLFVAACTTQPTRVRETPERQMESAAQMLEPIKMTEQTVVIDARPRFDYSMAHIPRSVPLQWSDFTEPEPAQRGVVQNDVFAIARRLARAGIGPDSHVVVVGRGPGGDGEEGRIAWMLAYLGVKRVQFAGIDSFRVRMTNAVEQNPPASVPVWKPEPIESLNVTRAEVQFAINKRATLEPAAFSAGDQPVLYRLIDVRPAKDYLGQTGLGARQKIPNMEAVNIPWQQFFTKDLRPNPSMRAELQKIGVLPNQRILVIDQNGVSSAAVTMALRALGYERAGNYAGGLTDLLSAYK